MVWFAIAALGYVIAVKDHNWFGFSWTRQYYDMTSTSAHDYTVDLESLHQYLHEEMANMQLCYQGSADAKHTPVPDFKVGDQVYVKAKYFQST